MPRSESLQAIDKHIGNRIRMRRTLLDMSLAKLGDALGIAFQQVQKYETGADTISVSRLHHISQILRVPPTFFFEDDMPASGDSKQIASPNPVTDFMATSEGLALATAFMRIRNKQMRRRIIDLVEEIGG